MIVLAQELIQQLTATSQEQHIAHSFVSLDDGDVFVSSNLTHSGTQQRRLIRGLVYLVAAPLGEKKDIIPTDVDILVVVEQVLSNTTSDASASFACHGLVRGEERIESHEVQLIPVREELFSRIRGMYETDVLQAKTVLIVGLGSGGATIAVELAKAGVGNFILVDHDRLEIVNVVRHVCGISDLGRFKTKAMRDQILNKNPFANVETYEVECDVAWYPVLRQLIQRSNIVFCCTDNRPSRTLINLACLKEHRTCIYGGTFRRAYGGQVLRVIPGQTMCYQCFIDIMPEVATDQEISNEEQAQALQYADHPVAIEPGLSTDIAPISVMCVKMGILEMLRGTPTTLASLYDDLQSGWFQWLNRREVDTEFADLLPLDSGEESYRILAWYGVFNERNPACPACGDFVATHLGELQEPLSSEHIAAFTSEHGNQDNQQLPPS